MKADIIVFLFLVLLAGVAYIVILHPIEKSKETISLTQTSSPTTITSLNTTISSSTIETTVSNESALNTPIQSQHTHPWVIRVNNVTLTYREEYGMIYASEEMNVSGLTDITILYNPREDYLEFFVGVKDYNSLCKLLKDIWNKSAIIYAEPPPNVVMSPYDLIVGPIPLGDAYNHLAGFLAKHVRTWSISEEGTVSDVYIRMVRLSEVVETNGMVLHLDLTEYMNKLNNAESFRSIITSPTYKGFEVGKWKVKINGVERGIVVRIRFVIPTALFLHHILKLHPSDVQYIVPLLWYKDPYFYKVVVPAFKFIADFLNLNYTSKAQLIKNFFSSLKRIDKNTVNFGDVLASGGSCKEFAFYSMMLARELGINNVYMLAVSPRTSTGRWVIAPRVYGHALTVTDDSTIGDTSHSIIINGKKFYVFVDNGWALNHWDKFLSMLKNGVAYLIYPNPQYGGEPSLTDISLSMYLLSLDKWKPRGIAPVAVIENGSALVIVYDEYGSQAFLESSGLSPNYMERFNILIPLYNVSSRVSWLFRDEMKRMVETGRGTVKVYNRSNSYSIIVWVKSPKTVYKVNEKRCTKGTCTLYKYVVCMGNLCFMTNRTKLCSPEPCWPEWIVDAYYNRVVYPNGMYEEIQLPHLHPKQALYRIVVKIPLIIQKVTAQ